MILIPIAYIIILAAEIIYLKKRQQKLMPYILVCIVLFLGCEIIYGFRSSFQIATLIEAVFGPIEKILTMK